MSTLDFSAGRGMAELSDRAYRVVVQDGVRDLDALAEALGRDRDSAREVVDMLARVGLMLVNGEAFEPRPPRMPLQALADQYVRAAAAAREASEVLAEVWSRQMSTSDFLEVVTTTAQAMEVMARLHAEADNDVRALSIGPRG